jgi:hypothetical protein
VGPTFMVKNSPIADSVARGVIRAAEKRRAQSSFYVQANHELLIPGCTRAIHAKCSTAWVGQLFRIILTFGEQMSLSKNFLTVSLLQKPFQVEKK